MVKEGWVWPENLGEELWRSKRDFVGIRNKGFYDYNIVGCGHQCRFGQQCCGCGD